MANYLNYAGMIRRTIIFELQLSREQTMRMRSARLARGFSVLLAVASLVSLVSTVSADMMTISTLVPATANPYLADPANVPDQTGDKFDGTVPICIDLPAGCRTFMIKTNGGFNNDPNFPNNTDADGVNFGPTSPIYGAQGGISSWNAPLASLLGIFLGPGVGAAPAALPFDTEFATIAPALGQVFFIGDGMYANGICQWFDAPAGATRLCFAVMDTNEWKNNTSGFGLSGVEVEIHCTPTPEPATWLLGGLAALGLAAFARRRAS